MAFKQFNPEVLTRADYVALANLISSIDGPFIDYYTDQSFGSSNLVLDINQSNTTQFTYSNTSNQIKKYYAEENTLMNVILQQDNSIPLTGTEYYYLQWQKTPYYSAQILFGNTLGPLPTGFNFGSTNGRMYIYISKQNIGSTITVQPINVTYVNNTSDTCAYRLEYSYSSQDYQYADSVYTQYSNFGSCFDVYASADLTSQTQPIYVTVYDNVSNSLLYTTTLNPLNNNINSWTGQHCGYTDIRVEFNY